LDSGKHEGEGGPRDIIVAMALVIICLGRTVLEIKGLKLVEKILIKIEQAGA